mmetsp:Transcript_28956/g.74303  ORF Transcript_28956/g.74303 Transcript_28956/m.74303 type:complete len:203 (+) Transcript_28956:66-674(+)
MSWARPAGLDLGHSCLATISGMTRVGGLGSVGGPCRASALRRHSSRHLYVLHHKRTLQVAVAGIMEAALVAPHHENEVKLNDGGDGPPDPGSNHRTGCLAFGHAVSGVYSNRLDDERDEGGDGVDEPCGDHQAEVRERILQDDWVKCNHAGDAGGGLDAHDTSGERQAGGEHIEHGVGNHGGIFARCWSDVTTDIRGNIRQH